MVSVAQRMNTNLLVDSVHHRANTQLSQSTPMNDDEQRERRVSIREVMQDEALTPFEKRKSVQALMDGRRRSSEAVSSIRTGSAANSMSMMAAAAAAAAEFYDSSDDNENDLRDDDDSLMDDATDAHPMDYSTRNGIHSVGGSIPRNGVGRRHSFCGGASEITDPSLSVGVTGGGFGTRRNSGASSAGVHILSGRKQGRSASLRGFAAGAAAAAVAAFSEGPEDLMAAAQRMEKSRLKCDHYERNCTIISPCCGLAFGCRICHDDSPCLPPPIILNNAISSSSKPDDLAWKDMAKKTDLKLQNRKAIPNNLSEEETHHTIDRFSIKEVVCRSCFCRQNSKTNSCTGCGIRFGAYHCDVCNLWMSADEDPYHCADCGFCRIGGRNNFQHCHDCGMCIDALLFDNHNCKAGKYMSNCPVCQEDLFSSRSASHEMPCGHVIHWHCFRELTSFDTRCPVCKKTAETYEQMAPTWSTMAIGISLQPVPPEMARVVIIICNDCGEQDENRRWHFLGVQCNTCSSFNTTVERTSLIGREAAAFLGNNLGQVGTRNNPAHTDAVMERSEALTNVMQAMEDGATALANLGIDRDVEDLRRYTIQAQLVNMTGTEPNSGTSNHETDSMEEDFPPGQDTNSENSHNNRF